MHCRPHVSLCRPHLRSRPCIHSHPDYDDNSLGVTAEETSRKDPNVAKYKAYMKRELPRRIRQELETAIEKVVGPLEEIWKTQLEDLIRTCQEELSIEYERSETSFPSGMDNTTSALAGPSRAVLAWCDGMEPSAAAVMGWIPKNMLNSSNTA